MEARGADAAADPAAMSRRPSGALGLCGASVSADHAGGRRGD